MEWFGKMNKINLSGDERESSENVSSWLKSWTWSFVLTSKVFIDDLLQAFL